MSSDTWVNPKLELRSSSTQGKGLFAVAPLVAGEAAVIWGGEYVDEVTAREAERAGKLIMQWDEDRFSVEERGDDDGYFINHSCEPNLWMKDERTLVARRDIAAGEELTADYALWEADENYVSSWECRCGSSQCRRTVTGKDWQNPELQRAYAGHFSPLINKRIAAKQ